MDFKLDMTYLANSWIVNVTKCNNFDKMREKYWVISI